MAGAAAVIIGLALLGAIFALSVYSRRWRAAQAESKRVRAMFERYVPQSIVEELLDRRDPTLYTGREVRATILVCRIWNFSHFIEKLTPEQTLRYLNELYAIAGSSIERNRGVLHRFLEDGVVGLFGVPLDDSEQEDHALRAAINIVRLVALMHDKWVQQSRQPMRVGIGINTGEVIAGDAGFAQRREYAVVGPDVALAHRLAAGTVDINAFIIASRSTIEPIQDLYNLVPVSGIPLTGMRALLDAFIVRGRKRGDRLQLPRADSFANTLIDESVVRDDLEPEETVPFEAMDAPVAERPAKAAPPPPPTPPPEPAPLKTRRRPRPSESPTGYIDVPELRIPAFATTDEEAIMPDPPPPRATYEDGDGPPLPL